MTWSTTEEDLLTSKPVDENMCSDGMDVPGILWLVWLVLQQRKKEGQYNKWINTIIKQISD
jgi:hypothetical protein